MNGSREQEEGAGLPDSLSPTITLTSPEEAAGAAVDLEVPLLGDQSPGERYQALRLLGEGGMGEVRLCKDQCIGREVAMKVLRPRGGMPSDARGRFIREARIQGQLEHPAVVPVYDLGIDAEGSIYFTMKRVRGLTLHQVLRGLRDGNADVAARYTRRRLLGAFSQACLAMDFAHARGVLHRDLKPGNVMLGDFGEVHLLDWGVAKLVARERAPDAGGAAGAGEGADGLEADLERIDAGGPVSLKTKRGEIMGSPGYMAPEQIRGLPADRRSDVYALGVLLFELLTLRRLHEAKSNELLLASTLNGADARASRRAPEAEVPPELEAICVRATALQPGERYASARELAEAVELYLDGDRDLELRRRMAEGHARAAVQAAEQALATEKAAAAPATAEATASRKQAMRELGRVLALDPEHAGALRLLGRLLVEPPPQVPAEVQRDLLATGDRSRRRASGFAILSYLIWLSFAPLLLLMGIRSTTAFLTSLGLVVAAGTMATYIFLRGATGERTGLVLMIINAVAVASFSRVLGPFILVPSLALISTLIFTMNASPGPMRAVSIVVGLLTIAVPFGLELAGVLPGTLAFDGGTLRILPRMIELRPLPTLTFLLLTALVCTVIPALLLTRIRDDLIAAEKRLHMQAWQLRQLVPDPVAAARPAAGAEERWG